MFALFWIKKNQQKKSLFKILEINFIIKEKMDDAKYKLEDLIGTLTSTGATNLDQIILKEIKTLCRWFKNKNFTLPLFWIPKINPINLTTKKRDNDMNCQYSYQILINHLQKEHSEIRYSTLQIIDCLFQRSHVFRELILDEFQQFFELVLGNSNFFKK